jgi:hypothetical protein
MKEVLKLALNALEAMQMYAAAEHKGLLIICDEAITAIKAALAKPEERNFCSRCGKRTADLTTIHTCTPPQENT